MYLQKFSLNFLTVKISFFLILFLVGCASPTNQENSIAFQSGINKHSNRVSHSGKTVVVYLVGFSGTGKYTIAKRISQHGYKVVDNHLINNPIFSLVGKKGGSYHNGRQGILAKINHIRNIVFSFIRDDNNANYVLTNELFEIPHHRDIYNNVQDTAAQRGSVFIPVKLVISTAERIKRISQPERGERFKTTDINEVYRHESMLNISHENLLELNVTNLSASEAAERIMFHVKRIKEGR